jgi:hypothetical protein
MWKLFTVVSCLIVSLSLTWSSVLAVDPYYREPIKPKSDFDRAMEQIAKDAKKDPPYTPPNPHEGRLQIPGTDYSVGGKVEPPTVNMKTTIP